MRGTPKLGKLKNSPFWYITFSEGRRSRRFSTNKVDREQAEYFLAKFLLERKITQVSEDEIRVVDMLERYKATKPEDKAIGYHMKHLVPYFKDMSLAQFGRTTIREYTGYRLKQRVIIGKAFGSKTVSPSTVRRELDTLSAVMNYAKREGYLSEVPHFEKPAPSKPRERWLTQAEVRSLINAAAHNKKLTVYLMLAINTGARPSSIIELKWFQIDLEERLIHFNPEEREQTKKHRPTVYINDALLPFLKSWRKNTKSEYVCGGIKSVKHSFRRACVNAKIKGATPYTLRHTAITWAIRDGHSLALAGQLAGHQDPRTTMRYAKHDPSFTKGIVESLATCAQLAHKTTKTTRKRQKRSVKIKVKQ